MVSPTDFSNHRLKFDGSLRTILSNPRLEPTCSKEPVISGCRSFPTWAWRPPPKCERKGPKRQGIKALGAVEAGHEPRLGSPIWRYELLEARRAVQSSAASVTQNSAFSAAVGPKLRESVCPRNSPGKAQHSTAARTSWLKWRRVANLLHWFSHRRQCCTLKYFDGRAPLASGDRPAAAQWLPMLRRDRRSPPFAAAAPFLRSQVGL